MTPREACAAAARALAARPEAAEALEAAIRAVVAEPVAATPQPSAPTRLPVETRVVLTGTIVAMLDHDPMACIVDNDLRPYAVDIDGSEGHLWLPATAVRPADAPDPRDAEIARLRRWLECIQRTDDDDAVSMRDYAEHALLGDPAP